MGEAYSVRHAAALCGRLPASSRTRAAFSAAGQGAAAPAPSLDKDALADALGIPEDRR